MFDARAIRRHAERFSRAAFRGRLEGAIARALERPARRRAAP